MTEDAPKAAGQVGEDSPELSRELVTVETDYPTEVAGLLVRWAEKLGIPSHQVETVEAALRRAFVVPVELFDAAQGELDKLHADLNAERDAQDAVAAADADGEAEPPAAPAEAPSGEPAPKADVSGDDPTA